MIAAGAMVAVLFCMSREVISAWPELGIKTDDGRVEMKFGLQLQPQYQFLSIKGQGKTNSFQMRRARLFLTGHAFTEKLTYKVVFEVLGGRPSNASPGFAYTTPNVRDAFLNYAFADGFQMKVGEFKVPYEREELTPDYELQFVDYSINNEVFTFERSLGLTVHGKPFGRPFEYDVFVMNGGNSRNTSNRNASLLTGARLLFNILGEPGYTMPDLKHSEALQLSFALAGNYTRLAKPDASAILASSDLTFTYKGLSLYGEGNYFRNQMLKTNLYGFLGEAGYFIVPEKFQIAARYAGVIPTKGVTKGYEVGGALVYYFEGQRFKITADYNGLINSALVKGSVGVAGINAAANLLTGALPGFIQNQVDHRVRLQLQLLI